MQISNVPAKKNEFKKCQQLKYDEKQRQSENNSMGPITTKNRFNRIQLLHLSMLSIFSQWKKLNIQNLFAM